MRPHGSAAKVIALRCQRLEGSWYAWCSWSEPEACFKKGRDVVWLEERGREKENAQQRGQLTRLAHSAPVVVVSENFLSLFNEIIPFGIPPSLQRFEFEGIDEIYIKKEAVNGARKLFV